MAVWQCGSVADNEGTLWKDRDNTTQKLLWLCNHPIVLITMEVTCSYSREDMEISSLTGRDLRVLSSIDAGLGFRTIMPILVCYTSLRYYTR